MAQFDVHKLGNMLVVDCQSDLLSHIASRLVVPLVPSSEAPTPAHRLNPIFEIEDTKYVMVTQSAGGVNTQQLGPVVGSLSHHSFEITSALDILISGV